MARQDTAPLRFATLIRVSTDQQERQGESLQVQAADIESDVQELGGVIVARYGGSEHATPGHEKAQVDKLLKDAARGKFNAVIVHDPSRWSRDNAKSEAGLEILRKAGIRFFCRRHEYNLNGALDCLHLTMTTAFNQFTARLLNEKSTESRIKRAKAGQPSSGRLPWGRTYDKQTKQWGIDEAKQRLIRVLAKRYIAGESMAKLADETGMTQSTLHEVLTRRCGEVWVQRFNVLGTRELIETRVPPLLKAKTINAIRARIEANRTFLRRQPSARKDGKEWHNYLLGRMVFCSHCGYAMFGQTVVDRTGATYRYYRHAHTRRKKLCKKPRSWVIAQDLEQSVFEELFHTFGNPVAVRKAMEKAVPNRQKLTDLEGRRGQLHSLQEKVTRDRSQIIRLMGKNLIPEADGERRLAKLMAQDEQFRNELELISAQLSEVPSRRAIAAAAERVVDSFGRPVWRTVSGKGEVKLRADVGFITRVHTINAEPDKMSWEDRRALFEMVFGGKARDGRRLGVYVSWVPGQEGKQHKRWNYEIVGNFIETGGRTSAGPPGEFGLPYEQMRLIRKVTRSGKPRHTP
jgi:DNA invertase Pin-like site-specific DNA recombinase